MVLYPYVASITFDGVNRAVDAVGQIYAKGDTTFTTPLQAVDASGLPVELRSNSNALLPAFFVEDETAVNWKSGSWVFPLVTSEPQPGKQGEPGVSVTGVTASGDQMTVNLSDGSSTLPITLPTAPGGSNEGVAEYIQVEGPTRTALNATFVGKGSLFVNVKDHGAIGDGVANDTAAIQAAINAALPGQTVWFEPGKVYALHSALTNGGKAVNLQGNGATLLSKTHTAQVEFSGAWGTVYPVSSVSAGTVTHNSEARSVLNLAVTGTLPYERGQVVKVYADDVIPGGRAGSGGLESRAGQFGVVYASTSGNLSILARELIDPLTTNIRVSRLTETTASIEGFTFNTDQALMTDGGRSNCVVLNDLIRPRVQSCEVRNSTAQAVQVNSCYGYRIKDLEIDESNDSTTNSQFGYGVLDNSSSYGIVDGLLVNFVRHAFSDDSPRIAANSGPSLYGRTYSIDVLNGMGYGTSNTTWDTHATSQNVRFINCKAEGSGGPGFGLRGRKHGIQGGKVGAGRDYGIYAFSESGTDTDSWGHVIDGVDLEATLYPITIAVQKASNTRETRKTYIDNCKVRNPNDLALWLVNASVNIGRLVFDNVQMTATAASNIKLENSAASIENLTVNYKGGLANNGPVGIALTGGSNLRVSHADIDINGTTNGTRFANYITSDAASVFRVTKMLFTSNPAGVCDFATTHPDSYIEFVNPAGNGLGVSSALIPWSSGTVSGPQHQLSRSLSPHIIYPGAIYSDYTLTSLRFGRFQGQLLTIVNVGTAVLTINNTATITTLTGAAITLNAKQRAQFYWDSTTWRQIA